MKLVRWAVIQYLSSVPLISAWQPPDRTSSTHSRLSIIADSRRPATPAFNKKPRPSWETGGRGRWHHWKKRGGGEAATLEIQADCSA
jgi:hypothetical protein